MKTIVSIFATAAFPAFPFSGNLLAETPEHPDVFVHGCSGSAAQYGAQKAIDPLAALALAGTVAKRVDLADDAMRTWIGRVWLKQFVGVGNGDPRV